MKSVWEFLYDGLKDRSYGNLFVTMQGICIALFIFGVVIYENGLERYFLEALPILAVLGIAWTASKILRLRREEERLKYPPLSEHELKVARSKLSRQRQGG